MPSFTANNQKMVPAEAIRDLVRGSFEQLCLSVDAAIEENRSVFTSDESVQLGSIATFSDHVVVGTDDGQYFKAAFTNRNGIRFESVEKIDVPVVEQDSAGEYLRKYALETVDAILFGKKEDVAERIASLIQLEDDSRQSENVAVKVSRLLGSNRTWRRLYAEQKGVIAQISESIYPASVGSPKYADLYNDTVPEEQFHLYREGVSADLSVLADTLERVQTETETEFIKFTECVEHLGQNSSDEAVLRQFADFAEDYIEDVYSLREHVAYALNEEPCVMCMAQVYDTVFEALHDYRVAGSFVANMSRQLAGQ